MISLSRMRCLFRRRLKIFEGLLIGSTFLFSILVLLLYVKKSPRCFLPSKRHHFLFFLETSSSTALTVRQTCAVESAALRNPNNIIMVLKLRTDSNTTHNANEIKELEVGNLKHLTNVEVLSFDIKNLVMDTPIDTWFRTGPWKNSKFKVAHLSDAMRYVVLLKCGGIYLDLDVVVLRSLEPLKNTVVAEHAGTVGNSFMVFDQGHEVLVKGLEEWTKKYDPNQFASNGPQLLSDNIRKYCGLNNFANVSAKTCNLNILPPDAAFPYPWQLWEKFFVVHDEIKNITSHFSSSYLLHFWNFMSSSKKLSVGSGTLYERVMEENCPSSYAEAKRIGYI